MGDIADVRIGFVGAGRHATANLYPAIALAGGRVRALATRDAAGAAAAAARLGVPRGYGSYAELLAAEALDAVFVSVDPADHARVTLDCLAAGVDVFVEKPLGLSPAEATAVADRADAAGRRVMVAFMKRFAPAYGHVAELMADRGRFGEPVSFQATFAFSPWTSELRAETFLHYAAVHIVDLVLHLFGPVADVSGWCREDGADIAMSYALRTDAGMVGTLNLASLASWGRGFEELTVSGTRGYVTATDLHTVRLHVDKGRPEEPPRWQGLDEDTVVIEAATSTGSGGQRDLYQRGFVGEVLHFLRAVADGTPIERATARQNVATMELCARLLALGQRP